MCLVVQHPPAITTERALTRYNSPFLEYAIETELALLASPSCWTWMTVDDRRILIAAPAASKAAKFTRFWQTPSTPIDCSGNQTFQHQSRNCRVTAWKHLIR